MGAMVVLTRDGVNSAICYCSELAARTLCAAVSTSVKSGATTIRGLLKRWEVCSVAPDLHTPSYVLVCLN